MITSLGIDPSISGTGLVLLKHGSTQPVYELEIKPKKTLLGLQRQKEIAERVMSVIHSYKPTVVVIEGYSFSVQHVSSIIPLIELGGILRMLMMIDELVWYDPKATQLKKFVSGSGNAKKDEMMMHVLKRWGYVSKSNNMSDAYGLAAMGLAIQGVLEGTTKDQQKIVSELGPKVC